MAGKRFRAEQIIMKLREAEVGLAQGQRVGQVSKQTGVTEQTDYQWRKEYGGLRMDPAKRLKILGKENTRLKKMGMLANLSWKLKRLQTLWFDGIGRNNIKPVRERSRDEQSVTFGEETQEVACAG